MSISFKNIGGLSANQKKLLSKVEDPQQRALQRLQLEEQNRQLVATTISNILKTRADGQMNTANNIR